MMETLTLRDVYDGLSKRMDTITDELVRIGRIVDKVTEWEEITVRNGNNKEYSQPRQQFFQTVYDDTKAGGLIDKKIDSCRALCLDRINEIGPKSQSERLEKKADRIWKWGQRIIIIFAAVAVIIRAINWDTLLGK